MYDVVQKDKVVGALTWLKQHNNYYNDIPINRNWYSMVDDSDIPSILLYNEHMDDIQMNCSKCKSEISDSNKNESHDTLENCNTHNTSIESDVNMMQHEIDENNIADESCSANDNEPDRYRVPEYSLIQC